MRNLPLKSSETFSNFLNGKRAFNDSRGGTSCGSVGRIPLVLLQDSESVLSGLDARVRKSGLFTVKSQPMEPHGAAQPALRRPLQLRNSRYKLVCVAHTLTESDVRLWHTQCMPHCKAFESERRGRHAAHTGESRKMR